MNSAHPSQWGPPADPALAPIAEAALAGRAPSDDEREKVAAILGTLYDRCTARAGGNANNTEWPKELRAHWYVHAIKASAMHQPQQRGWPYYDDARRSLTESLHRWVSVDPNPWAHAALVMCATAYGRADIALYAQKVLARDAPALGAFSLASVRRALLCHPGKTNPDACRTFLEHCGVPLIAPREFDALRRRPSDEQWVLAAPMHPEMLLDPRADLRPTGGPFGSRADLDSDWGIVGRQGCLHKLSWLLRIGARARLPDLLSGKHDEDNPQRRQARAEFVRRHRTTLDARGADAFDLCAGIEIARNGVGAGYLSEAEGWAWSRRFARELRVRYANWTELGEAYALSRTVLTWSTSHERLLDEVRARVSTPGGLWQIVSYDTSPDTLQPRDPRRGPRPASAQPTPEAPLAPVHGALPVPAAAREDLESLLPSLDDLEWA